MEYNPKFRNTQRANKLTCLLHVATFANNNNSNNNSSNNNNSNKKSSLCLRRNERVRL